MKKVLAIFLLLAMTANAIIPFVEHCFGGDQYEAFESDSDNSDEESSKTEKEKEFYQVSTTNTFLHVEASLCEVRSALIIEPDRHVSDPFLSQPERPPRA